MSTSRARSVFRQWLRRRGVDQEKGTCRFSVDGVQVRALQGQNLAAAMIQAGHWCFHRHPLTGEPRGAYCGMGVCFECEVLVDGVVRRACLTDVHEGLLVRTDGL